ncbi:hypothetical protein C2G38_503205 [Gigaspora rosea]|uniref:Uncharacterized protein n=1 Tax=Gigaspora rosea TaxID=44941 RepID=A0A397UGW5_9GLOM|nr:hypothetical protein C2G38_503205 [Gigaspora rosea]
MSIKEIEEMAEKEHFANEYQRRRFIDLVTQWNTKYEDYMKEGKNSWIGVDLKEIRFFPNGRSIFCRPVDRRNRISLIFRYNINAICLGLEYMHYEIVIPLHEILGLDRIKELEIEVSLKKHFIRVYYHNSHKGYKRFCRYYASTFIKDPTRGALQRVEKIVLKLSDFVNPALVIMVIDAIKKNIPEKREINRVWKYNFSSRKTEHLFLNKMLEIICVFLIGHLTITFPYKGTINDIFDHIQKTLGIRLDFHQIRYTNVVGDLIDLKSEEDWRVAKWEAVRWHNGKMVLQIGNYL